MNKSILNTDVQNVINENLDGSISEFILKGSPFQDITIQELAEQIEAKKKCRTKLPTWFETNKIYYPNKLNIEQTSSEETAQYKSDLIHGQTLIDLTGGLGVDDYYFSKKFKNVFHCEINKELSDIAHYNFDQLKAKNIQTIGQDGLEFLKNTNDVFDWIYIDPSRRHDAKGKVFLLEDCLPNVPEHLDFLFSKTNQILIKTSPLLDISIGLKELSNVKEIHVVAVLNEVKELLWILEKNTTEDPKIVTVNLGSSNARFEFSLSEEKAHQEAPYSVPKAYLYEPNSAILKSGAFKVLTKYFQVQKLHQHSHLYTSDQQIDFPGRAFKITQVLDYNKKALKSLKISKANITTRNFPESVEQLRKKFKIKDGGSVYLFFTTNCEDQKVVLICEKLG